MCSGRETRALTYIQSKSFLRRVGDSVPPRLTEISVYQKGGYRLHKSYERKKKSFPKVGWGEELP